MSQTVSNCPNCGAPVKFLWSGAVQTTCEFCHSILIREDLDLKKVGEVADLPPDSSAIQIGTEGAYRNKPFVVVGRIIYDWLQGSWNEWYLMFSDSSGGWVSDAQGEYDVSFQASLKDQPLPVIDRVARGGKFKFYDTEYEVTSLTHAHYRGVQGELPFQTWKKDEMLFVDLRSADGRFGTIDYTETPPLLFLGEPVEFEDLHFKNLRTFEGW